MKTRQIRKPVHAMNLEEFTAYATASIELEFGDSVDNHEALFLAMIEQFLVQRAKLKHTQATLH